MAIKAIYRFRNPDSTQEMNQRFRDLIQKGIFIGGNVTPIVGQLKVQTTPFSAASLDGMIVIESSYVNHTIPAGQTSYLVLRARYLTDNDPVLTYEVLESNAYNTDPEKAYLIVFCVLAVPTGATAVIASHINTTSRHEIDTVKRLNLRGVITGISLLPASGSRPGDTYLITDGSGDVPAMYTFNGVTWVNITQSTAIAAELALHRSNAFSNEIHLTDNQALAAAGTFGTPNDTNRYVTSTDPRLPTQDENDALAGSDGAPSDINRYVTQAKVFATQSEYVYASTPVKIELPAAQGPFYVGKGGLGTPVAWFSLYDTNEDREYTTTKRELVKLEGVFTDANFTVPLNPTINPNVDVDGFFVGASLWILTNINPDSGLRVLYGKKGSLKDISVKAFIERGPKTAQLDRRLSGMPFLNQQFMVTALSQSTFIATAFSFISDNAICDIIVKQNGVIQTQDDFSVGEDKTIVVGVNDKIDFRDPVLFDGVATIPPGSYAPAALATMVQTQLNASSTTVFVCTYDPLRNKFTISNNNGSFTIKWSTGTNAASTIGGELGFDVSADDSGSTTYTSNYEAYYKGYVQYRKLTSTTIEFVSGKEPPHNAHIEIMKLLNY